MPVGTLSRVGARSAAEVCKRFELGPEGTSVLKADHTPDRFLDALMEKKQWSTAIRFLAHALPKPEVVWWACVCARAAAGATPTPAARTAIDAAEKWLSDPSEGNRQATLPAAKAVGLATSPGSAAMSAYLSGGSLGPSNVPPIPPGENMAAQVAGACVLLAAVQNDTSKALENFQAYLAKGIEVAKGNSRWPARK